MKMNGSATQVPPKQRQSKESTPQRTCTPKLMVMMILVGGSCLCAGFLIGAHSGFHNCSHHQCEISETNPLTKEGFMNIPERTGGIVGKIAECHRALHKLEATCDNNTQKQQPQQDEKPSSSKCDCPKKNNAMVDRDAANGECEDKITKMKEEVLKNQNALAMHIQNNGKQRLPREIDDFAVGMSIVDRDAFGKRFDMGVPLSPSRKWNDRVLILYGHINALPKNSTLASAAKGSGELPFLSVDEATEKCNQMNVLLIEPSRPNSCLALMGQWNSYHVQKWMRLPDLDDTKYGPLNSSIPLQLVNRGAQPSGRKSTTPPKLKQTLEYWEMLRTYLGTLGSVLEELKPIAEKVARNNTIVVMVCNHGQSELLMNFACSARSRGLDISSVLVFATDEETKELADGLGLAAFYDKVNYGDHPKEAARQYGDGLFRAMMMAKVYCVQMISMLGYDVLFQDADVVWFRDPLPYFHDKDSPSHGFDIYFQDDGNRALYYAPYAANTGFYYVRSNDITISFFNSLLVSGDLITSTNSHQIALISILAEHASRYGMKAKVLSKLTDEFPGGQAYHERRQFMKDFFEGGKVNPYIFHMSWTENKKNKLKFLRQMGEWYLQDNCVESTVSQILGTNATATGSLVQPCCSKEPLITCFYKDKPSKIPCPNSPAIDPGGVSFW